MSQAPHYDCQQCGACCTDSSGDEGYVWLNGSESRRLQRMGLSVVRVDGEPFLESRANTGRGGARICVAFRGRVGGSCGCSVYEDRPGNCRRFEVGSTGCRRARQEAGLSA